MKLSRRHLLIGTAALTGLAACSRETEPSPADRRRDPATLPPPLDRQLIDLENYYNAFVGLYGVNLASGRTISNRDSDSFAMCSTFKAYLAARVLQGAQRGELKLDDRHLVEPNQVVGHSPVIGPLAGSAVPVSELCKAALQQSDNTAANALLRIIGGPPAITEFARSIGDDRTRLDRWETELNSAIPGDPRDTSTPRALGEGFRVLLTETKILDEQHRQQLESWMRGGKASVRGIRAGLPPEWTSADKTGTGDYGTINDIGVVYGPNGEQLLLAVMTRTQSSNVNSWSPEPLVVSVTKLALPALLGQG